MAVQFVNDYMMLPTQYVPLVAGDNDDMAISSSSVSFIPGNTGDAVTGMIPPDELTSGGLCFVSNADTTGTKTIVIKDNDAGSMDIYRFHLLGASTLTLPTSYSQLFYYVPTGVAATTGWYPQRNGTFA